MKKSKISKFIINWRTQRKFWREKKNSGRERKGGAIIRKTQLSIVSSLMFFFSNCLWCYCNCFSRYSNFKFETFLWATIRISEPLISRIPSFTKFTFSYPTNKTFHKTTSNQQKQNHHFPNFCQKIALVALSLPHSQVIFVQSFLRKNEVVFLGCIGYH